MENLEPTLLFLEWLFLENPVRSPHQEATFKITKISKISKLQK